MLILIFLTCVSDSVELQIELKSTLEADKRARQDFFRSTSVRDTWYRSLLHKASQKIKWQKK